MKWMRFKSKETPAGGAYGRLADAKNVELMAGTPLAGLTPTGKKVLLDSIQEWLPPVDPVNVIAIGANYVAHCKESQVKPPDHPLVFIKATSSVVGHQHPVVLPSICPAEVDYEGELAVIIGKSARNVKRADALSYVLGYTIANDVSARDIQLRIDSQWARGKSFDTFCPLGPVVATDLDPSKLRIQTRVAGEMLQDAPTSDMMFDVGFIIEFLSAGMTLLPGTVILTGTPEGVGLGRNPKRYLKAGEVMEVTIDGIGTLRNPVKAE